jgi:hypothetical protein
VTGFEWVVAIAIRSENQYIEKLKTRARTKAIVMPPLPPIAPPTRTNTPPRAAIRIQVFSRLIPGAIVLTLLVLGTGAGPLE